MSIILISVIIIMSLILIAWTWNSLGSIEKTTKIACIVIGILLIYILTFIIFNISKIGITYEKVEVMKIVRKVFVTLFTIINGYVILPYVFKKLEQINNEEIERQKLVKSMTILAIIVIIIAIFEVKYLGNAQNSILSIMANRG